MAEAETYTHGHHESVLAAHRWRTIANSAHYLEPHLRAGRSLLDVGCGPGTITAEFAERLAPGRVVGVDAAPDALAAAAELETRAEFVLGDAYALPFDDETFDIVHTHQTLQHVRDPVEMLREMARVARGGGHATVDELQAISEAWRAWAADERGYFTMTHTELIAAV